MSMLYLLIDLSVSHLWVEGAPKICPKFKAELVNMWPRWGDVPKGSQTLACSPNAPDALLCLHWNSLWSTSLTPCPHPTASPAGFCSTPPGTSGLLSSNQAGYFSHGCGTLHPCPSLQACFLPHPQLLQQSSGHAAPANHRRSMVIASSSTPGFSSCSWLGSSSGFCPGEPWEPPWECLFLTSIHECLQHPI